MKKLLVIAAISALCIYACHSINSGGAPAAKYFCYFGGDSLCDGLPFEVLENFNARFGYSTTGIKFGDTATAPDSSAQTPLDLFSWQTFVALNWPADASGKPTGSILNDDLAKMRVWEHYSDPEEIFTSIEHSARLAIHLTAKKNEQKFFYLAAKRPHLQFDGSGSAIESDGFPLIDVNKNFAVYEIKLNSVESTFITTNSLTTDSGIYNYAKASQNSLSLPASDSISGSPGMMEIKASWRILLPSEDSKKFYCRSAKIYMDSLHTVSGKPLIIDCKVGLVGMHIIRKTPSLNQGVNGNKLIWSTFEHVDNAPDSNTTVDPSKHYSFFDKCDTCGINVAPQPLPHDKKRYLWDTVQPYAKLYINELHGHGSHVMRVIKVAKYTEMVNKQWQAKLANTVWANYKLVGTQWQLSTETGPKLVVNSAPPQLGNTSMETYEQTNTCIGCHQGATIKWDTTTVSTDLSFVIAFGAKR